MNIKIIPTSILSSDNTADALERLDKDTELYKIDVVPDFLYMVLIEQNKRCNLKKQSISADL